MYDMSVDELAVNTHLESTDGRNIKYLASAPKRPGNRTNPECRKGLKPHKHSHCKRLIQDTKAKRKLA